MSRSSASSAVTGLNRSSGGGSTRSATPSPASNASTAAMSSVSSTTSDWLCNFAGSGGGSRANGTAFVGLRHSTLRRRLDRLSSDGTYAAAPVTRPRYALPCEVVSTWSPGRILLTNASNSAAFASRTAYDLWP